jgi:hypothetical protein
VCLPSRDPFRGGSRRIRESTAEEQVLREEGGLAGRAGRVILTGFGRPCDISLIMASARKRRPSLSTGCGSKRRRVWNACGTREGHVPSRPQTCAAEILLERALAAAQEREEAQAAAERAFAAAQEREAAAAAAAAAAVAAPGHSASCAEPRQTCTVS